VADFGALYVTILWFQVSVFSAASGLKSGQFDRKRNIQSFTFVLSFDVGRWTFDIRCSFLSEFHTRCQFTDFSFLKPDTRHLTPGDSDCEPQPQFTPEQGYGDTLKLTQH